MEKRDAIKNPLTLIALFAGLSEVGMTTVLPFLPHENQSVFMWFVMIYPSILVCMFFYVLIWKREALYAPSDFKDDSTFLAVMRDKERKILEKYPLEPALSPPAANNIFQNNAQATNDIVNNSFYRFLMSLGLDHDTIVSLTHKANNADELSQNVAKELRPDVAEKIRRVFIDFQGSKDDFLSMKRSMDGGAR